MAKYHPFVIGVTGSIGKTSSRHAIAAVLSARYRVREPLYNYNTDFGIMYTLFGTRGWKKNHKGIDWPDVFLKAFSTWLLPQNYPEVLVLEYGIDHPGDMDELVDIVKPNMSVLTTIGISHREFFSSAEQIASEKGKLVEVLSKHDTYVYNADDILVAAQTAKTQARKISYGKQEAGHNPDIILTKVEESLSFPASSTLYFKTPTRELNITVPVVGTAHEKAILAAVAVAESLQVETDLIIKGLANYRPVPGRLNVLPGIKKSILIDDTYNAAPVSTMEALRLLARFSNSYKVAVLGDMLELGDETNIGHADVGQLAAQLNISRLVTVGELGKKIGEAAASAGMSSENIVHFVDSEQAKSFVLQALEPDSVILIKGSQGARMEKIVKELLAEPTAAGQLLVRQYGKWLTS